MMLFSFAAGITLLLLLSCVLLMVGAKPSRAAERLFQIVAIGRSDTGLAVASDEFELRMVALSAGLRERLGLRVSETMRERLFAAGLRGPHAADTFAAAQWLAPLLGVFAASFIHDNVFFWIFACGGIAYMLPGLWVTWRTKQRTNTLRRSLPDTMDLLVICVDAGLGIDQALMRVSEELAISHKEIQQELHRIHLEQRAGSPRLEAWKRFATRSQIDEIAAFVSMLSQTDRFGTPIARALARFAEDLRTKRRQRAEEAAAKTKVKIVFPLVFFIFPCLFIVLLAPALMGIMNAFEGLK